MNDRFTNVELALIVLGIWNLCTMAYVVGLKSAIEKLYLVMEDRALFDEQKTLVDHVICDKLAKLEKEVFKND